MGDDDDDDDDGWEVDWHLPYCLSPGGTWPLPQSGRADLAF